MSGILVDTCVWSLALRGNKSKETELAKQSTQLADDNQVKIIGAIRQELLSGYSDKSSYDKDFKNYSKHLPITLFEES